MTTEMITELRNLPKLSLKEVLNELHKKSYIKNKQGVFPLDAFIAMLPLLDTTGHFVQRADIIYRYKDDKFIAVYLVSSNKQTVDREAYGQIFGSPTPAPIPSTDTANIQN